MKTYQDFEKSTDLFTFIQTAITDHKASPMYQTAVIADAYYRHRNTTINQFQKVLYTVTGRTVPDNWSANYKMACNHFKRFIDQEISLLLSNGVSWNDEETKNKLGTKRIKFDDKLQNIAKKALQDGVAFGFFNLDHIEVFRLTEFVPLVDEETGVMRAGIRFYQISEQKPLTVTFFEEDGYAVYLRKSDGTWTTKEEKRPYKLKTQNSIAFGEEVIGGENYSALPVVPLWANSEHQSTIIGMREQIDCYDLIKSGFADTVDEASYIFWTLTNSGGMDDIDLATFVERMKTLHAHAFSDDSVDAQAHTLDAPFESRVQLLDLIDKDLYRDAMAVDTDRISSGSATATEIRASYEPLNAKVDDFEYQVLEFIYQILEIAGIKNEDPTFQRTPVMNVLEEIEKTVAAAAYLPQDYVTKRLVTLLGDGDKAEEIIKQIQADEQRRMRVGNE